MRMFLAVAVCALMACQAPKQQIGDDLYYDNNDLELLTGYRAKELCSCLFVMGQSEEYCSGWTIAAPNLATFVIDRNNKRVETAAVLMWNAAAHWESERFGCILE